MTNQNLTYLREREGLTQDQLCEKLGIKRTNYSKWELGLSKPKIADATKIANFYRITIDDLFTKSLQENPVVQAKYPQGEENSFVKEAAPQYESAAIIRYLEDRLKRSEESFQKAIASLEQSLETIRKDQVTIAAMTDAAQQELLRDVADRTGQEPGKFLRNVRTKALSVLSNFRTNGIQVPASR